VTRVPQYYSAMTTRTHTLHMLAPIPVGHRVRLEIYAYRKSLLQSEMVPRPESPIVHDLDTGIRWASDWHVQYDSDVGFLPELAEKAQPTEHIEGVVRECHVIGSVGPENARFHTILVLDPPPEAKGYR
jgi:hypothetical protein